LFSASIDKLNKVAAEFSLASVVPLFRTSIIAVTKGKGSFFLKYF
jgi:stalled ribosome alternative rescue factor ArfA